MPKGLPVGTVHVALEGKPVAELSMVALQDVPQAGFVGRTWDSLLMMWQKRTSK